MKKLTFFCPKETTDRLHNPERGYYSIVKYTLGEEIPGANSIFMTDSSDALLLLEVNLCNFADREIPEECINDLKALFGELRIMGVQLIVRFLYDWEGKNLANEPRSIEIIQRHMQELGETIQENADIIFVTQGLFIGNWGEMHGTRYSRGDYLKKLYNTYADATAEKVRLSVRTPAQWRCVTGYLDIRGAAPRFEKNTDLPGLFNDGIMGDISDMGTYPGMEEDRKRELKFQEYLCRAVPNGGEVVGDDERSDADRVHDTLAGMHVSYLNRDYDPITLEKWKSTEITGKGIWKGISCFDYVERHLGYRFVIADVKIKARPFGRTIKVAVAVKNAGFAPIYHEAEAEICFVCGESVRVFPLSGDVRELFGCNVSEELVLVLECRKTDIQQGENQIYFRIRSKKYGCNIELANEGKTKYGYNIGRYVRK